MKPGEAAGPAPSWPQLEEVLTLSLQSDPLQVAAGGRMVLTIGPADSPLSRDCKDGPTAWHGVKGFSLKSWCFWV